MHARPLTETHRRALALLIDRDADTRHMYVEFLRRDYDVEEAEDGREALAKALTYRPDVIVTETRLAGINGFELCKLLRLDSQTCDIPIVVVTADAFEADVRRATNAGADVVLTKPCLPGDLGRELRRVRTDVRRTRDRLAAAPGQTTDRRGRSAELVERLPATGRRTMLSRAHNRRETSEPPVAPPALVCPECDQPLHYVKSHVGGVSAKHQEQWDYFECRSGCGTFQYRQRTRRLRLVK